jgi:hypothetical protein
MYSTVFVVSGRSDPAAGGPHFSLGGGGGDAACFQKGNHQQVSHWSIDCPYILFIFHHDAARLVHARGWGKVASRKTGREKHGA